MNCPPFPQPPRGGDLFTQDATRHWRMVATPPRVAGVLREFDLLLDQMPKTPETTAHGRQRLAVATIRRHLADRAADGREIDAVEAAELHTLVLHMRRARLEQGW